MSTSFEKAVARSGLTVLLSWALTTAYANNAKPWELECETRLPVTVVEVKAEPSQITYDFTKSVSALTQMHKSQTSSQRVLGLTVAKSSIAANVGGTVLSRTSQPEACTRPILKITLRVAPHIVYVAKEFPQGSCAFNHIAKHELSHVQVNQQAVELAADELQIQLTKSFGNRVFYGDPKMMNSHIAAYVKDSWLPWVQSKIDATHLLHEAIDSPAEYAKNNTVCGGEIEQKLRSIR